jgi:hypothetical protein
LLFPRPESQSTPEVLQQNPVRFAITGAAVGVTALPVMLTAVLPATGECAVTATEFP